MCIPLPGVGLQCVKQVPGNQILLEWRAPSLRITERRDPVRTLRVWAASPRRPAAPISRRRAVRAAGPRGRRCATSGRMSQLSVGVCMEAEFRAQGDGEPGMELLCGVTTCDVTMTWGESRWDFYSDVKFRLDATRHASIGAACSAAAVDYSCFFKNPHFCTSSCFFCSFFHFTHDSNNRRHFPVDFFFAPWTCFFFFQLIYFFDFDSLKCLRGAWRRWHYAPSDLRISAGTQRLVLRAPVDQTNQKPPRCFLFFTHKLLDFFLVLFLVSPHPPDAWVGCAAAPWAVGARTTLSALSSRRSTRVEGLSRSLQLLTPGNDGIARFLVSWRR